MHQSKADGNELYVYADLKSRDELLSISKQIKDLFGNAKGINWQADDTWHITLCFCFEIDKDGATAAISKADNLELPFNIRVSGFGIFENKGERALYLKVDRNHQLNAVQKALYDSFEGYEISPFSEPREYKPHITMAYLPDDLEVPEIQFEAFEMTVDRVAWARGDYEEVHSVEKNDIQPQKKWRQLLSQAEAGYVTVSPNPAIACVNCRFYSDDYNKCAIVEDNMPYPIAEGGYCNEHRNYPVRDEHYNPTGQEMNPAMPPPLAIDGIEVIEVGEMAKKPVLHMSEDEMEAEDKPKKALSLVDAAIDNLNKFIEQFKFTKAEFDLTGFKVFEDGRFLAWWTNNFTDKQEEIISEYAIDEFIDKATKGLEPMPELWWMHIRGTKHGQVEKLFRVGHFALAVGRLDDEKSNPLVPYFKSWYAKQKNITMSHGFYYKPSLKQNGVYHHIRSYEISSLIAGREANPYTSFEVNKMSLITETQRADLEREFGKEFSMRIIQQAELQGKALEAQNIAFKSLPSGFGSETLLLLGAVKTVQEDAEKAIAESTEAHKEAKDVGNRLSNFEKMVGDYRDSVVRLTEKLDEVVHYVKELTSIQPPASKSPLSQVAKDNPEANFLQKKNEEAGQKFVPILEQMRKMGEFNPPNPTD